jgi:hypothetical protein
MRVTFDTNTLRDIVLPDKSQRKPTGEINGNKVRAAIQSGKIHGVFCEVLVTLEGIENADRCAVMRSTAINPTYRRETGTDGSLVTNINLRQQQPARKDLNQKQADRFLGAFELGVKLLRGAPRVGKDNVTDPEGTLYLKEPL